MLVARGQQPLKPVEYNAIFTNKSVRSATLFYSKYLQDDKQYFAYQDSTNNSGKLLFYFLAV